MAVMSRLPIPPDLEWKNDGTPVATRFDDVYYSLSDGLEETRSVFLKACGLPERWRQSRNFTVGELGFGTGLNFLGLVECWLKSERRSDGWLHFVSVEKHPLIQEDAAKALAKWPELKALSDVLVANWPDRSFGMHRRVFPEWRVTLTIDIGEAETALAGWEASMDAWFLDGFAPSKNDDMWGAAIYSQMARLSASGCIVGTYTVAGAVRRGLTEAGFDVSKQPGFGRKRERLEAVWPASAQKTGQPDPYYIRPQTMSPKRVVITGAGIAGACLARVFADRGLQVDVLEADDHVASGASGNPLALLMPRLDAAETAQARVLRLAYLHAIRFYNALAPEAVDTVTTQQIAQNDADKARFAKLAEDPPLGPEWLVSEESQSDHLLHRQSLMLRPRELVESLLTHEGITVHTAAHIEELDALRDAYPVGTVFILATAGAVNALLPDAYIPLVGKMGQVEFAENFGEVSEPEALASGTYALRRAGALVFGATFETLMPDEEPYTSRSAQEKNSESSEASGG